jgi:cysteinyl-tRNA synthetase
MNEVYLTNTLTRKKEKFISIKEGEVGIYSCGPTVYWNQHIGHMYAYVQWDTLVRFLRFVGYKVTWVMNITDVGHMTSDEDYGEDKMEKGAKREGVSVWDLANKYIDQFKDSMELLNINPPDVLCRATEHIDDQINLIKKIEANGFTYKTKIGVVFDTEKFSDYAKFAHLDLERQKSRSDVEEDAEKKKPWDFLLWVTGNPGHIMQWDSPWGKGYPGWHVECTAMSTKYLGDIFDIHTGGIEHIAVHHTNEIAQGFGAFGHSTAKFWLHNAWLTGVGGEKMSKSLGNYITVQDLVDKGYDPLSLRYLILTSNYRKGLNFSWKALSGAQATLNNLKDNLVAMKKRSRSSLSEEKRQKIDLYRDKFVKAMSDDINSPQALAVLWEVVKSNIPSEDKYDLVLSFDEVLGLGLSKAEKIKLDIPQEVKKLLDERDKLRLRGEFNNADKLRKDIEAKGFIIEDNSEGSVVKLKKA